MPVPLSAKFDLRTSDRLMAFQADEGVKPANGDLDQKTLDKLWPFFDWYGRWKYGRFKPPTHAELVFEKLLARMKLDAEKTPGYLFGGQHGIPISDFDPSEKSDCSSSTSDVLHIAGLFEGVGPHKVAAVSGELESWGEPGKGKMFTVYASADHVWIRLYKTRYWRFDTSPHGDGGRGPRLRMLPRFTSGFVARHARGM